MLRCKDRRDREHRNDITLQLKGLPSKAHSNMAAAAIESLRIICTLNLNFTSVLLYLVVFTPLGIIRSSSICSRFVAVLVTEFEYTIFQKHSFFIRCRERTPMLPAQSCIVTANILRAVINRFETDPIELHTVKTSSALVHFMHASCAQPRVSISENSPCRSEMQSFLSVCLD